MDPFAEAGITLEPLAGGWSGETFVGEVGGERSVVRIYGRPGDRGAAAHEIDAALLRLVRGLLPVPRVLEVVPPDPARGSPAVLVTELLAGERGDLLLPTLDDRGRHEVGRAFGRVAATLGGMPTLRSGLFVDADLTISPFDLGGLVAYVGGHADRLQGWTPDLLAGLAEVAAAGQDLLDEETRTCVVHSDLNPKNLLVDPETLAVTGVLDWEFAHAGHPFTDLGNLLRFDRAPAYVDGVLDAYAELRGTPPERALGLGRAADLYALVELAGRAGDNPVATAADGRLRAIAAARDPHAVEGG